MKGATDQEWPQLAVSTSASRSPFIDAMRAVVASLVAWHHFAFYEPLWDWAVPGESFLHDWLLNFRGMVQVFFIISGYVAARTMAPRAWGVRQVGRFAARRYCRLGVPYLATIALAIGAAALARGWLPEAMIGMPPTVPQVLAHVVLLQDILGYESLSAGLWFVAIEFQLGLIYAAMLWLRDAVARRRGRSGGDGAAALPLVAGLALSLASLFYFSLDEQFDVWAVFFFGQFFLGVMVYLALARADMRVLFWLYVLAYAAALAYFWRWRLAISLATGLILYAAGVSGLLQSWPASRVVAYLGRTSYSLFLVHFPVLIVVSTLWVRLGWSSPWQGLAGLFAAYFGSLAVGDVFYRAVEAPSARLSHRFS